MLLLDKLVSEGLVDQWVAQFACDGQEVLGLMGLHIPLVSLLVLPVYCGFLPCTVGELVT